MAFLAVLLTLECEHMRFSGFRELLSHWNRETPDAPAFLYGAEEKLCISYSAFYQTVMDEAERLRTEGKTCLGILCDGSLGCVTEIFAANLAGLQIVLLDPTLPASALSELVSYTDTDCLWGNAALCDALASALTGGVKDGTGKILFFTSGTTQHAKAVVLSDASLCSSAWNGGEMLPLSRDDVLLSILPLNHVFGFVCGLLWGMSFGCTVALGRGPRHYFDDCDFFRPTAISLVPAMLAFFLRQKLMNEELRLVLIGAGGCPIEHIQAARAMGKRVSFGYGLTETSSGVAISTGDDPYAMAVCPDDRITLDGDGEILIQAPTCMMAGYYKMPSETAEILRDGVLHSGDLGFFDAEGKLHITGRKKEMFVLPDGTKVFLPEYESELAACLGNPELALILREEKPVLVFSGQADPDTLMEKLRPLMERKPRGQRISRVIVIDEKLPRTATGKVKRMELEEKVSLL